MSEMPEFSSVRKSIRMGGKDRRCEECGGLIERATEYVLVSGKWEGEFESFYFHDICWQIAERQRAEWSKNGVWGEDLPGFGQLVEYATNDAHEMDAFPEYWPAGIWISRKALADYVKARHEKGTNAT